MNEVRAFCEDVCEAFLLAAELFQQINALECQSNDAAGDTTNAPAAISSQLLQLHERLASIQSRRRLLSYFATAYLRRTGYSLVFRNYNSQCDWMIDVIASFVEDVGEDVGKDIGACSESPRAHWSWHCDNSVIVEFVAELRAEGTVATEIAAAESRTGRAEQEPFVLNEFQQKILAVLDGRALKKEALAEKVCGGVGSRLYKKSRNGDLNELMDRGIVCNKRRLGYYRPDRPPRDAIVQPAYDQRRLTSD